MLGASITSKQLAGFENWLVGTSDMPVYTVTPEQLEQLRIRSNAEGVKD